MALSKSRVSIWSSQTLTAGAGNTTSSTIDLTGSYGTQLDISLTNGTAPGVAAQVQVQVGADSGGTLLVSFGGPLVGSTSTSAVTSWSIELPIGVACVVLVAGSNTTNNVTVNADLSKVTAL